MGVRDEPGERITIAVLRGSHQGKLNSDSIDVSRECADVVEEEQVRDGKPHTDRIRPARKAARCVRDRFLGAAVGIPEKTPWYRAPYERLRPLGEGSVPQHVSV